MVVAPAGRDAEKRANGGQPGLDMTVGKPAVDRRSPLPAAQLGDEPDEARPARATGNVTRRWWYDWRSRSGLRRLSSRRCTDFEGLDRRPANSWSTVPVAVTGNRCGNRRAIRLMARVVHRAGSARRPLGPPWVDGSLGSNGADIFAELASAAAVNWIALSRAGAGSTALQWWPQPDGTPKSAPTAGNQVWI